MAPPAKAQDLDTGGDAGRFGSNQPPSGRIAHRRCRSGAGDVEDGLGEGLGRLLRQVVADAAGDGPVLVPAGRTSWRRPTAPDAARAVGIALHRDRRDGDDRRRGQPLLQSVVTRLALGQPLPPAVVVDDDVDMVGVVERCGAAVEGGVVEPPFRRGPRARSNWRSRASSAHSPAGPAPSRSRTGTTNRARPSAAAVACRLRHCR